MQVVFNMAYGYWVTANRIRKEEEMHESGTAQHVACVVHLLFSWSVECWQSEAADGRISSYDVWLLSIGPNSFAAKVCV